MKTIKNLTVKVTYTATLSNVEVSEKEYEALKNLAEYGSGDPFEDFDDQPRDAFKWVKDHIRENDDFDLKYEVDVEQRLKGEKMETVENEKGFRVLKIDRTELLSKTARFGAIGVCDRCGHAPHTGYYVAVLNYWLCPECFRNWYQDAEHYEEDLAYEEKKYRSYRKLFTSAEQEEQE